MTRRVPNINCLFYYEGLCSHASARTLLGVKPCVLSSPPDVRCQGCRFQVEHPKPAPPAPPPRAP